MHENFTSTARRRRRRVRVVLVNPFAHNLQGRIKTIVHQCKHLCRRVATKRAYQHTHVLTPVSGIKGHLWRVCRTSPGPLKSLELSTHTVHKLNTRMGIPTSSWACTTNSWAAPAQRTGADLPATLVCWQLGILHQQLGLLGRVPAGLALERPVWSCHGLDTWLLLHLRSCTRMALAQGWTDGRAGRAGRTRQQRRVLDCPRADFRVKSLPMGRYPLILRSRIRWWPWRRRAVSGMG